MDKSMTVIEPKKVSGGKGNIRRFASLSLTLAKKDLKTMYTQTLLGPLWHLINPVLMSLLFAVVFGRVARISTDGIPAFLFYMSSNVIWNFFSSCFTRCSSTFLSNARLFSKVYFPRLTVPISGVISRSFTFAVQFVIFAAVYVFYALNGCAARPNLCVLLLPVIILVCMILSCAAGLIISSLTVKYRDISVVTGLMATVWMYLSPVVYPVSSLGGALKTVVTLNPMTGVIETFRYAFLSSGSLNIYSFLYSILFSVILFILAVFVFKRTERNFADKI